MPHPISFSAGHFWLKHDAPVPLCGYAARDVSLPIPVGVLGVNWAIFNSGPASRVLLFSIDALFSSTALEQAIKSNLAALGLEQIEIMSVASHTHFAPSLDATKPRLGVISDLFVTAMAKQIAENIFCQHTALAPVLLDQMAFGQARCASSVYRRRLGWRVLKHPPFLTYELQTVPNRAAPIPQELRLWMLHAVDEDAPRLCIASYPCHPVSREKTDRLSADYVAALREKLRDEFGDKLTVIFFPGPSGDIRPDIAGRKLDRSLFYPYPLREIFLAPDKFAQDRIDAKVSKAASRAVTDLHTMPMGSGNLSFAETAVPLDQILSDGQGHSLNISCLTLGPLKILGCGAELTSAWLAELGLAGLEADILVSGYVGQCDSYLPTDAQIAKGGYEVDGFRHAFDYAPSYDANHPINEPIKAAFKTIMNNEVAVV